MLQEKNSGRREKSCGSDKVNKVSGPRKQPAIMVSACLAGDKCSYDGRDRFNEELMSRLFDFKIIKVCPEMLGGLSSPRERSEISHGTGDSVLDRSARVVNIRGSDVTDAFIEGANSALRIALERGIKTAILKARSPSCGSGEIYSGLFDGSIKAGDGVLTALLKANKIKVYTEENYLTAAIGLNCKKVNK